MSKASAECWPTMRSAAGSAASTSWTPEYSVTSAPTHSSALRGHSFGQPRRHGKHLIVPVRGTKKAVLPHFGMTGSLQWATSRHRHDRIVFAYGDHELTYRDMRKLHGLRLARDEEDVRRVLAELGPDAAIVAASGQPILRAAAAGRPHSGTRVALNHAALALMRPRGDYCSADGCWGCRQPLRRTECAMPESASSPNSGKNGPMRSAAGGPNFSAWIRVVRVPGSGTAARSCWVAPGRGRTPVGSSHILQTARSVECGQNGGLGLHHRAAPRETDDEHRSTDAVRRTGPAGA